jgi:hypothetical protein
VTTARDNVTLAAWVNWKGSTGHDEVIVLNGHGAFSGYGLVLWNAHSDHVGPLVSGIAFGDSGVALPICAWRHLALVRAGGVWTVYVNGVPAGPTWTYTPNTPDTGTFIGNDQNSAIRFNGLIDDVRIYNSALSAAQIAALASGNDVMNDWTTSDPIANPTVLDARQGGRVAYLTGGSGAYVTLENLTVRGGYTNNNGGGIYDDNAPLTLSNAIVRDNVANGGWGGGVCVYTTSATLNVNGGQILSNTADGGGGVHLMYGSATLSGTQILNNLADGGGGLGNSNGTLTVVNSTLSGNGVDIWGGGIYNAGTLTITNSTVSGNHESDPSYGGGAFAQYGSATIVNCTVVSNTAATASRSGIWLLDGTLNIQNSIVAHNGVTNNVQIDGGTFTSLGYNLTNSGAGTPFTATTDLTNTNPLLGPLQDNGGATWTHALLPGSPAIDRIPLGVNGCGTSLTTDQRGQPRPGTFTHLCDVGAYEAQGIYYRVYLPVVIK